MNGFQLEIQKDLNEIEMKTAIDFANTWISKTCSKNLVYYLGGRTGGYKSFLRRGTLGYILDSKNPNSLVFRRISHARRVFGIVKSDTLMRIAGTNLDSRGCICPEHRGGEQVIWKNRIKPKTFIYAKIGIIKEN